MGRIHLEERVGAREVVQVELGWQAVGQVGHFHLEEKVEV